MKTLISFILFISVLTLLSLNSCSNSTEPLETNNIDYEIPVVPGLILTAENDPTPLGIWRNPHLPNGSYQFYGYYGDNIENEEPVPINLRLHTPYPNPANGHINIGFALSVNTKVSLWLVRAKLPEDNYNNIRTTTGGVFVSSNPKIVLLKNIQKNAGVYQVIYDWTNGDGESLPAGFYRVYLTVDGHTLWCDVLLARKITDLPPDLRGKVLWEK